MKATRSKQRVALGSVSLGDTFVFRTSEILGLQAPSHKPPYEGRVLTVIGFKPRYVNNILVRDETGTESLLPLEMAEKALSVTSRGIRKQ